MYYLKLIQQFWEFNQIAKLNTTAVALYFYLLKSANDNDSYDLIISDVALGNALGIARKTVIAAKEKLRNFGLIKYNSKNGMPCHYRLLLDFSMESSSVRRRDNENKDAVISYESRFQKLDVPKKLMPTDAFELISQVTNLEDEETIAETPQKRQNSKGLNHPSWDEFFEYVKTLDGYDTAADPNIKVKYDLWCHNNWKNTSGRPITSWKSTIKSILPYLKNSSKSGTISIQDIPHIKRPES